MYNYTNSCGFNTGIEIFFEITFLVASHDYNSNSNYQILQEDFLDLVNKWIKSFYEEDLDENLYNELFMAALKTDDPITNFLDVLKNEFKKYYSVT
ncbi:MAG: hypothetical protein HQK92_14975 [Nitrospirae bacterium]|nr:hypothetical protein [Nitrospirota bacterium]